MSPQPPDLVVGIDLGTTYTGKWTTICNYVIVYTDSTWRGGGLTNYGRLHKGISYCIPKLGDLVEPPVINNWPGRENEVFNKVPTVVAFTGARVASWGFDAQLKRNDNRTKTEERFKLLLDKKILDEINKEVPVSMKEVENWFRAFLGELYDWISKQLEVHISDLQNMTVEYIFSVSATWEEETVERYLKVIKEAGFGSMDRHSVSIGLNEAEAAAVQTAIYNSNQETDGYKVWLLSSRNDDGANLCDEARWCCACMRCWRRYNSTAIRMLQSRIMNNAC